MQERLRSYLGNFYPASASDQTYFLGIDWKDLSKELAGLGFFRSIYKMSTVVFQVLKSIAKVIQSPLSIDYLMPGTINFAYNHMIQFTEIEKELTDKQIRFHHAKIKYLVATQNLPLTYASCQKVFQEAYREDHEYRKLCERSFQEVYIPFLQDRNYRQELFLLSYFQRMGDFLPSFMKACLPVGEKIIKEKEKRGILSTRFADLNLPEYSALEVIDLVKKTSGIPHTLAITKQTRRYEKKLRRYNRLVLDDEEKFNKGCRWIAYQLSHAVYEFIWQKPINVDCVQIERS
jgi:hypothetical protein